MSIDGLDKEEITEKLNKILITDIEKYKDGLVISIDGRWGIGKTVFWKQYTEEELIPNEKYKENDIVYVSLFGKNSIESINSEILLKVSRKAKASTTINKLKERYSTPLKEINKMTFGIGGLLGSVALSILSDKEFEGKVICFDDFERISDNISHKDVMGLISSLKEDKKCKIVMIMHQEKMEKKNNKVSNYDMASTKIDDKRNVSLNFNTSKAENSEYAEYKEKIVDIELFYSPSIDTLFNVVKDNIEYEPFKEYAIKYLKDTKIKNIRVMKRIVTALNDFAFIKDWRVHETSKQQIAENILEVSTVYALYHFSSLKRLSNYTKKKVTHNIIGNKKKKFTNIDELEKVLKYIYYDGQYIITPTTEVLEHYIKTSKIDKDKLRNVIEEDFKLLSSSELYDDIRKLGRKYLNEFSFSSKDYSKQLYNLLKKDKKRIINLVNPSNFLFYIDELIKIDKDKEVAYNKLLLEAGRHYIDNYLEKNDNNKSFRESEYNIIISRNKDLTKYAEEAYKQTIELKMRDRKKIFKAMSSFTSGSYHTADVNLMKFITKDECKIFLKEEKEFVEYSFDFLRASTIPDLDNFRKELINAHKELSDENEDLKYRIRDRIFKIAKIPIEEEKTEQIE